MLVLCLLVLSACGGAPASSAPGGEPTPEATPEATPEPTPETTPEPTPEATVKPTAKPTKKPVANIPSVEITVEFKRKMEEAHEYATVTASHDGEVLWTYQTAKFPAGQLDAVSYIQQWDDATFLVEGGTVVALDIRTGKVLWKNDEFGGASIKYLFHNGKLLLSGYFGPDLFIVTLNGKTVGRVDSFGDDYYWPCRLSMEGEKLRIDYECNGEPSILVDLNDMSFTEK